MKRLGYIILKRFIDRLNRAGIFESIKQRNNLKLPLGVRVGVNCTIDPSARFIMNERATVELMGDNFIGRHTEIQPIKGGHIRIGYGSSIQDRNYILGDVEIGRYCLTAPNVYISSGRHYFNMDSYLYIKDQDKMVFANPDLEKLHSKKVTVEDDVWIGINSVLMSGVTIGRGSIVGSNSVVTKDVPPYSVVAGNPATCIKKRLEFKPKNHLVYSHKEDLPNFYKGFFLAQHERQACESFGGIWAGARFTVYLDASNGTFELEIKTLRAEIGITYQQQTKIVSCHEFQTLVFEASEGNYHYFSAELTDYNPEEPVFLVKQIKAQQQQ